MFEELYQVREDERATFGQHWCGPGRLPHAERTLVAQYPAAPDGDGSSAEVYVEAMPARFYTVRTTSPEMEHGAVYIDIFHLKFGSGQAELAAKVAEMLAAGMLTIRRVVR